MSNKTLIVAILLLSSLGLTAKVDARGPSLVGATVHNLSSSGMDYRNPLVLTKQNLYRATNVDQVCVFCHTPHGGSLDAPLWNRSFTGAGYNHYSSSTLSTAGANSVRAVNPESLICLSCHDGSVSVGDGLINNAGTVPSNSIGKAIVYLPGGGAKIGAARGSDVSNDLTDDHPISISYTASRAAKLTAFKDLLGAEPNPDLPLFSGPGYTNTVECSTCHDPHVNYQSATGGDTSFAPFLAMSNAGSAMCLACHNK